MAQIKQLFNSPYRQSTLPYWLSKSGCMRLLKSQSLFIYFESQYFILRKSYKFVKEYKQSSFFYINLSALMIESTNLVTFEPTGETLDCQFAVKLKLAPFNRMQLAYNNTFIIEDKNGNIRHVNHDGKKLTEIKVKNVYRFLMLSEDKVGILSVKDKENFYVLTFWNLIDKSRVDYEIPMSFKQNYELDMVMFKDSEVLCICEDMLHTSFRLSYFKIPVYSKVPFHIATFQSPCNSIMGFKKLNQHSMVGFFRPHFTITDKNIVFYTYNLKQNKAEGQTIEHSFEQWFYSDKYLMKKFQWVKILEIVEVRPMFFYLQLEVFYSNWEASQFYSFYWNHKKYSMESSRLNISTQHRIQFISCLRDVDYEWTRKIYEQQKLGTVYSLKKQRIMVTNLPIYYVEPQTQQVICTHPLKNKVKQTICWPTYKCDRILQYYYNQKEEAVIEVRRIPDRWQIHWQGLPMLCTFMLTELVADCEEDLLQGVVELLPAELEVFFKEL